MFGRTMLRIVLASMVKRISRDASDVEFWVRFLVEAHTSEVRMCLEARLGDVRPGIEDLASILSSILM